MTKIRALITLVVGKGQELPPGGLYDLSDDEAKRLASLNFAEIISKNQILLGFPHPSGANVNRVKQFKENKDDMAKFIKEKLS